MRRLRQQLILPTIALLAARSLANTHHALAEDPFAFPKYRVTFLNSLPVLNETAQHWLTHGLAGGELEFLDQPWQSANEPINTSPKRIESGDTSNVNSVPGVDSPHKHLPSLHLMRLSPSSSYICLVPPPSDSLPREQDEDSQVTPSQSWSLLQPLSGSCLYHRQGWFTYAYCHNYRVRQFREMAHSRPHVRGHFEPEEDPVWEAYTLGQAAETPDGRHDLTNVQEAAISNNVDIARAAGHRYLVQRWGDGTVCDRTGEPREIEVQFHCSMTMTDTILFVKETKTCHYVMVINTPRLCGEPGFKNRMEQRDEAFIRCREVLDSIDAINAVDRTLPESPHPHWHGPAKSPALHVAPVPPVPTETVTDADPSTESKKPIDILRSALEALMSGEDDPNLEEVRIKKGDEGELWIEFLDENTNLEGIEEDLETILVGTSDRWEKLLRNAEDKDDRRGDGERRRRRSKDTQKPEDRHDEL